MPVKKATKKTTTQVQTGEVEKSKKALYETTSLFLLVATLFMIILVVVAIMGIITVRNSAEPNNTITVTGDAEVYAVPDIATVNVTMRGEQKDVTDAQAEVSKQAAQVIDALKKEGVLEKDIKTSNYSSNPRYEYQRETAVCPEGEDCIPGDRKRVLVGYEVHQTLSVKIRNIENAGQIIGVLGSLDVENIYGPNFEIEDRDALRAEARNEAIKEARQNARDLADELGVKLGKMIEFNEGGNYPVAYARTATLSMDMDVAEEAFIAPEIPTGENQVNSSVTLTFKIK